MTIRIERRTVVLDGIKVEQRGEGRAPVIRGHAAVFNKLSEDLGGWKERIQPGAFQDVLKDDVRALFNHEPDWLLGRTLSGTLSIAEDREGLAVEITPPATQLVRDLVLVPIERGDLSQMSFAFSVAAGGSVWEEQEGVYIRTIMKFARLYDVSPVTYPAYPQTDVGMSELRAWRESQILVKPDYNAARQLRIRAAKSS